MVVYRFLAWMERAPAEARAEAVAPLVRSFFLADVSEEEREAIDAALTLLLDDPALDVRRTLAETLALYETAPRHLIIALAGDRAEVAAPVFQRSPSLLDAELVDGVRTGGVPVQLAIARRPWVSETVSDAIAREAEGPAALALLQNPGSDIGVDAFLMLVDRFGADAAIRTALFSRADLPIFVRQALIARLAQRLDQLIPAAVRAIPPKRLETVARDACDRATVILAEQADEPTLEDLVDHLCESGQLTATLLIRAMCAGQIRFFEAALARLADMPPERVYGLLSAGRDRPLSALFRKAGLPERTHPVFLIALGIWRSSAWEDSPAGQKRFVRRMIDQIVARFQADAPPEVEDILALLRRIASEAAREAARALVTDARRRELRARLEDPMLTSDFAFEELGHSAANDRLPALQDPAELTPETLARALAAYADLRTERDYIADFAAAFDSLDGEAAMEEMLDEYDLDAAYEDALRELAGEDEDLPIDRAA